MRNLRNLTAVSIVALALPTLLSAQGRAFLGPGAQVAETFDWSSGGTVQNLAWEQNADQTWALPGTTQKGWYARFNDDPAMFAITNGTTNTGGGMLSNFFYTSGDNDRSLGGRPTNAGGPLILALRLTNVSAETLNSFSIAYAAEVTQQRDASVSNGFIFEYSLSASVADWADAVFVQPGEAFNATTPLTAVASNVNGNSVRSAIAAQTVVGIDWQPGTDLWLRWTAENVLGGPNLGLDDVVFTAFGDANAPPAPATSLAVEPVAATTLQLTWLDNSGDETGFSIERSIDGGPFTELRTLPANLTLYRDQNLTPDATYAYRVIALRDDTEADPSNVATWNLVLSAPAAPSAFAARVVSWNTIYLTWERNDYNGLGFALERLQDDEWQPLANLNNVATLNYVDTALPEGTTFSYRLRAFNDQGSSPWQVVGPVTTEVFTPELTQGADPITDAQIAVTLYVDPSAGDDTNGLGTASMPFRTIEHCITVAKTHNAANEGVKIVLLPGVYLEGEANRDVDFGSVILSGYWSTSAPLVIEGAGWEPGKHTGDVIITGAEEWRDWSAKNANGVQTKPWPYDWGLNPRAQSVAPDVIKRLELLWVREPDGEWRNYIQVLGPDHAAILDKLAPTDGYFWVDEAADTISVRPPDGVDLNAPNVLARVTTRKRIMHHWRPQVSTSLTPFAIRNVVFEHAGDVALYLQNVRHITVEDCVFRRNKIDGFSNGSFGQAYWTLRNNAFYDNGVSGWTGGGSHLLAENLEIRGNGRLAYLSNYQGWANEGMKVAEMHNSVLRNWRVYDNWGVGIWIDTGVYKMEISGMIVYNNRSSGIFIENNNRNSVPGLGLTPTVILRDSVFFNNSGQGTGLLGRGVSMGESENVFIENVASVNNEHQLAFAANVRGENFNGVIADSMLGSDAPSLSNLFLPRNALSDWQQFYDTLDARTNDNVYILNMAAAFTGRSGEPITFPAWQAAQFSNPFNLKADKAVDSRSIFIQADYDATPLLNVFPVNDTLAEGEAAVPVFVITRLGSDLSQPQLVDLHYTDGLGFFDPTDAAQLAALLPASVTIPAGEIATRLFLSPLADGLVEGRQVLEVSIAPVGPAYTTHGVAQVTVLDADVPAATSEVFLQPVATLREGGEPVTVTASRIGNLAAPVTVNLSYSGTATLGVDYQQPPASLSFAAGSDSATFTLSAIDNDLPQPTRSLQVTIATDGGSDYLPVPPATQSIVLEDNDTAVIDLPALPIANGTRSVQVPLTLHNPTDAPLTLDARWPNGEWLAMDSRQPDSIAFNWLDNSADAHRVAFNWNAVNDDGYTAPLALGFELSFFDNAFDAISINSNGFFTFGPLQNFTRRYSLTLELPNASLNTAPNMVAPFWDDFSYATDGAAFFSTSENSAIVTWDRVARSGARTMTFQSVINASGVIKFQYKDVNVFPTPSAGIQNADRTRGLSLAFGEDFAASGTAVALVPNHAWIRLPDFPLTLQPGEIRTLVIDFDLSALEPARYAQSLELFSDSPAIAVQRLPVALSLSPDWLVTGSEWNVHPQLGLFYAFDQEGLLYHVNHGFLFAATRTPYSIYLYSWSDGWLWTNVANYPYVYSFALNDWVLY